MNTTSDIEEGLCKWRDMVRCAAHKTEDDRVSILGELVEGTAAAVLPELAKPGVPIVRLPGLDDASATHTAVRIEIVAEDGASSSSPLFVFGLGEVDTVVLREAAALRPGLVRVGARTSVPDALEEVLAHAQRLLVDEGDHRGCIANVGCAIVELLGDAGRRACSARRRAARSTRS